MSQSGNHFIRKPSEKTIRVAVPAKPGAAPEKARTLPDKPPVVPAKPHALPDRPAVMPAKPYLAPEKPAVVHTKPRVQPETHLMAGAPGSQTTATYSKIFRWRLPDGQTQEPSTVEIAGSFTNWEKVPLTRDGALDSWHATVHHIQAHKTHHYMLLVDGKPTQDKNADGIAPAHGPQEERFQIMTPRGPRVFMLFAQAK